MRWIKYIRFSAFMSLVVIAALSCSEEEIFKEDGRAVDGVVIRLRTEGAGTRSGGSVAPDVNVRYIVADENGAVVSDYNSHYDASNGQITIESIARGSYSLYVLGYSNEMVEKGLRVNESVSSSGDEWFSFEGERMGWFENIELYYVRMELDLTTDTDFEVDMTMGHLLALNVVALDGAKPYLRGSVKNIDLRVVSSHHVARAFSVDGVFSGSMPLDAAEVRFNGSTAKELYSLPALTEEAVEIRCTVESVNYKGERLLAEIDGQCELVSGSRYNVLLDLASHPDFNVSTQYVTRGFVDANNLPKILQDDEPKSIFYDRDRRHFFVNQPLQLAVADNSLHTRFYSAVPIIDVKVWAQKDGTGEAILLAVLDSVPAFSDAGYHLELEGEEFEFITRRDNRVTIGREELERYKTGRLTIDCDDTYWQKIEQIVAGWKISFASYGGDPDAPNGAPAGNWMGIRPVHIREAVALLTNIAYCVTMPEYIDSLRVHGDAGRLVGNGFVPITAETVLRQINGLRELRAGLVYTGNGVNGLGGGSTWGIAQYCFLEHYSSAYYTTVAWHELGHCMGYGHESGMTYGFWAGTFSSPFYVDNLHRLPVNSASWLNSSGNPNRY